MDDTEYRLLCAAPDVLRRTEVRATAAQLRDRAPHLAAELERLLRSTPVPKPREHQGRAEADFLWVDLDPADVEQIREALRDREVELAQDPEADGATLSWVAQLADRWNGAESSRSDAV
jgi:hypothetical protein